MSTVSYTFGVSGSAHTIRAVIDAQVEVMEPFLEENEWVSAPDLFKTLPVLRLDKNTTMAFGGLEAVVTVFFFVATVFVTKVVEDVYERTAKRPVGKFLDKISRKRSFRQVSQLNSVTWSISMALTWWWS
jgi:hypothetical protein